MSPMAGLVWASTSALCVWAAAQPSAPAVRALLRTDSNAETRKSGARVAEIRQHVASGVWTATFEHGAVVHHRRMPGPWVSVEITLAGGELLEDAGTRGLTAAAAHSLEADLARRLAAPGLGQSPGPGPNPGPTVSVELDAVRISLRLAPGHLDAALESIARGLSQAQADEPLVDAWKARVQRRLTADAADPAAAASIWVIPIEAQRADPRLSPPSHGRIGMIHAADVDRWLRTRLATSPLEAAIVGPIDRDEAIGAFSTAFADLAPRPPASPGWPASRRVAPQAANGPFDLSIALPEAAPASAVLLAVPAPDASEIGPIRRLNVASRVMADRLAALTDPADHGGVIRSVNVSLLPGEAYPGMGRLVVIAGAEPRRAAEAAARLESQIARLVTQGPTAAEVESARSAIAAAIDRALADPTFWAVQLSQLRYRGRELDLMLSARAAYEAIGPGVVHGALTDAWGHGPRFRVISDRMVRGPEAPDHPDQH